MLDGLTIGELAQACGVSRDTLRFYERQRLLPVPRRSASRYRLYRQEDAARVRFVRQAQAMGLTLDDIRELLRAQTLETPEQCRRVAGRLGARVVAVDEKIAQLRAFREELVKQLRHCEQAAERQESCPVVLELGRNAEPR